MSEPTQQLTVKQDNKLELQDFLARLNREPNPEELDKTPDGKAKTLPISFIEMTLDEIYLGDWGHSKMKIHVIANEVTGILKLWVRNPITGRKQTRVGAASIIIQVDKAPDNVTGQDRNNWALNPSNKKPNALDLGFPKLKAECVKNAAQSLGKVFGRDINRKKADKLQTEYKALSNKGFEALMNRVQNGDTNALRLAKTNFTLSDIQIAILEGESGPKQLN